VYAPTSHHSAGPRPPSATTCAHAITSVLPEVKRSGGSGVLVLEANAPSVAASYSRALPRTPRPAALCQTSSPRSRSRLQPGIAPRSLAERARLGSSGMRAAAAQSQQHRLAARCPRAFASAPSPSRGVLDGGIASPSSTSSTALGALRLFCQSIPARARDHSA